MYNVNWLQLIQLLMPWWWRKPRMVALQSVFVSGVASLHAAFLVYRDRIVYDMKITGQTIYLEKALNDRFDPTNRDIYIDNPPDPTQLYLFNKVEGRPPLYVYNKWSSTITYQVGQFAVHGTYVWRALLVNTNVAPSVGGLTWVQHGPRLYLKNKNESPYTWDFIVFVPVALTFDVNEMRALVNRYKLAGKKYTIQTY